MIQLRKLYNKPRVFQRLTGLTPKKFQELEKRLVPLFRKADLKQKMTRERKRAVGAGNQYKLSVAEALFMLLLYYRAYTNHVFLGMIMGIDDSNVCRYFRRIEPLLAKIFRIPERKVDMSQEEILEIIIDATEQETERRKGSGYSGKKKRMTVKTQVVVTKNGRIKSVSKSVAGNIHDKKLYDSTKLISDPSVKRRGDLGYLGTACAIPKKKQKGKDLSEQEKLYNRQFSRERIVVEHVIAHLKKFKILDTKFRNKIPTYNLIFKNIAGIRNLQLAPQVN